MSREADALCCPPGCETLSSGRDPDEPAGSALSAKPRLPGRPTLLSQDEPLAGVVASWTGSCTCHMSTHTKSSFGAARSSAAQAGAAQRWTSLATPSRPPGLLVSASLLQSKDDKEPLPRPVAGRRDMSEIVMLGLGFLDLVLSPPKQQPLAFPRPGRGGPSLSTTFSSRRLWPCPAGTPCPHERHPSAIPSVGMVLLRGPPLLGWEDVTADADPEASRTCNTPVVDGTQSPGAVEDMRSVPPAPGRPLLLR